MIFPVTSNLTVLGKLFGFSALLVLFMFSRVLQKIYYHTKAIEV